MQLEVGAVLEGKVTGITKFGAFVSLEGGKSGLVHISEIATTYVNDVSEHLTQGQAVKVRVIGISDEGKINLSIKKALEPERPPQEHRTRREAPKPQQRSFIPRPAEPTGDSSFEDKLKRFMADSDSKNSGNRLYSDKRSNARRRRD